MEAAITVCDVSKVYKLYKKPVDRLKEALALSRKKLYKEHYALNHVSFQVNKGETVGIIGTNGAGKSTLLKIITGVLSPTSGTLHVNGKISALLELGTGFNPEYSGIENIYLNGTMSGFTREEMDAKLEDILKFADIGEFVHQPVKTYSSGMFARLAFAVSINVDPEILIVDEALSVGDMRFQIKCMDKMKSMMERGTTVLFVSHDINSVRRFCTRAVWLRNGEVEADGEVNQVSDRYMDYLKVGEEGYHVLAEAVEDVQENGQCMEKEGNEEVSPENAIAEIVSFQMFNENGEESCNIGINEPVRVEMVYQVYDEGVKTPVAGIAIRGMDDDYVCGLNSLLDKYTIPWKLGKNKISLSYPYGLLAVGGQYYFDVALFDQTATVPIQYISVVKKFTVHAGYVGEGRYIIPHQWS